MAGVPPQSMSHAPQAWVQSMVPPEGTPAPHPAWWFTSPPPPSPVVQGPWGQPQHLFRPAGTAPGSSVALGAIGPVRQTPTRSQAPSCSPAPSGKINGING